MTDARVVAVGLLTQGDLELLRHSFDRLWPVDGTPCFGSLLCAIDQAERELWREHLAHIINTLLSLGLNLLIARLGLSPQWRYAVWALIAANELRGLVLVYQVGDTAFSALAG